MAEIILRRPIFPGQTFDIMGKPKSTDWIYVPHSVAWIKKLPEKGGKDLKKMMGDKFQDDEVDLENCTDFLYKLLTLNPNERISSSDAMFHPYFVVMHDTEYIERVVDGFLHKMTKEWKLDTPHDVHGIVFSYYIGDKDSLPDA